MSRIEPRVFVQSRTKIALISLICGMFIIAAILLPRDAPMPLAIQLAAGFFVLCELVMLWLLVRPQRLDLDQEGFTLSGGLMPPSRVKKIHWRDVDRFFVFRTGRGNKMIGMNFNAGANERTRLARWSGRAFGAEGGLPGLWPGGTERMIQELTEYREQALGRTASARCSSCE